MHTGSDASIQNQFDTPRFQRLLDKIRRQYERNMAVHERTIIFLVVPDKVDLDEFKSFLHELNRVCCLEGEPSLAYTISGLDDVFNKDVEPDTIAIMQAHQLPQPMQTDFVLGRNYHLPRMLIMVSKCDSTKLTAGRWTSQFKNWFERYVHEHYWPAETTSRRKLERQIVADMR